MIRAVLLLALSASWCHAGSPPKEDAALIRWLAEHPSLTELNLVRRPALTNAAIAALVKLEKLKRLTLPLTAGIDAKGIARLRALPALESLTLTESGRATNGAVLEALRGSRIQSLHLAGISDKGLPRIGPKGLDVLQTLPELKSLTLNKLIDKHTAVLPRLKKLESLHGVFCHGLTDAGVAAIGRCAALDSLYLDHAGKVTDVGAGHLAKLSTLTDLRLYSTLVGDAGLKRIADGCRNIRWLYIANNRRMTDIGIRELARLPLHEIYLQIDGRITPACLDRFDRIRSIDEGRQTGLCHLYVMGGPKLTPGAHGHIARLVDLHQLSLPRTSIDDAALAKLVRPLRQLIKLQLAGCPLTDVGVAALRALPDLGELDLSHCVGCRAKAFAHLAAMPKLHTLTLAGEHLVDADVEHIARIKQLKTLRIHSHKISATGIRRLKALLPKCAITH